MAQQRIVYSNDAWWQPEDKTNDEFIFAMPKGKFDYVTMRVGYLHTMSRADIDPPVWTASDSGVWSAQFALKSHVKMSIEQWQESTASGYNLYTTALRINVAN